MLDPHIFPGHIPMLVTSCDIHLSRWPFRTPKFCRANLLFPASESVPKLGHQLWSDYGNIAPLVLIKFSHFGFIPPVH